LVIHWMADPVPGLGIAVPVFMPVVVTAIVAMLLSREDSAPLASKWSFRTFFPQTRRQLSAHSAGPNNS
jgi:uncharacterized membrane protein